MSIGGPSNSSSRRSSLSASSTPRRTSLQDESPPPSRRSSMSSEPDVSERPFPAPGFSPSFRLTNISLYTPPKPSFKEASTAVAESSRGFERMGDPVSADEYRENVTNLGETVSTVRAWLDSTIANDTTLRDLDKLSIAFNTAKTDPSPLDALFDELQSSAIRIGNRPGFNKEENSHYQMAAKTFVEAKEAPSHEFRCQLFVESTRRLMDAHNYELDQIETHMQTAEANQMHMADNIDPENLPVTSFAQKESETVLRPLKFVLNYNDDGAKPETFDMDAFIQLLYSKTELGNTLATATNYHYYASQEDISKFVPALTNSDLKEIASAVQNEIFNVATPPTQIDIGAYLKEILDRAGKQNPPIETAADLLKAALKYIRPESPYSPS